MKKFMGTPYPWRWFTSNSHARLSSEVTGKDGDVIHAYKAYDGMACVNVSQSDMAVIAAAPELLEALQDCLGWVNNGLAKKCHEKAVAAISKALGGKV